jgi:hypothetical protein
VNIAARLEALAESGGVLVSHTVHDHARVNHSFRFDELGERSLKNIERPGSGSFARAGETPFRLMGRPSLWQGGVLFRCPIGHPSPSCPSTISAASRKRPISATGSPRRSSPVWRGSARCLSSPAIPPSRFVVSRWSCPRSDAGSASPIYWRAACGV